MQSPGKSVCQQKVFETNEVSNLTKVDTDSYFKNTAKKKKKVKANERRISLCFYHHSGFAFDASLSHRHTLLIFVHSPIPSPSLPTPINHYFLTHYTLNTYMPSYLHCREGEQGRFSMQFIIYLFLYDITFSFFLHHFNYT